MRIKCLTVITLFLLLFSEITLADENKTIGVGYGLMYNGLGVMYGIKSESSLKYLSLGCLSVGVSDTSGISSLCGIGIGYITSNLFKSNGNKHGLGIHIGTSYSDTYGIEAFIAPQYIYFLNGIVSSGLNIGVNVSYGKQEGTTEIIPGFQIGYQF